MKMQTKSRVVSDEAVGRRSGKEMYAHLHANDLYLGSACVSCVRLHAACQCFWSLAQYKSLPVSMH